MVNFFTDEVRNYMTLNSDVIGCMGTHQSVFEKVRSRLDLVSQTYKIFFVNL
jgi:hypothetical protein